LSNTVGSIVLAASAGVQPRDRPDAMLHVPSPISWQMGCRQLDIAISLNGERGFVYDRETAMNDLNHQSSEPTQILEPTPAQGGSRKIRVKTRLRAGDHQDPRTP
jgi:hypothetical protein